MYNSETKSDKTKVHSDLFAMCGRLIILGAFLVVLGISLFSEWGVHPDEWDVRTCLDWGISHWIWPDMRAEGVGDTYSWYGYTKVCNYSPYFLIAGKIAGVFKTFMGQFPYFRMPNLLLMLALTIFMLRKLKKHKYLMLFFGICVQAWYIFAYVTADALDFAWAFIAIYMLADEDSFLWRTIDSELTSGAIGRCIILGILFGMMLLGKPYYYANMVLVFVVLLIHLINSKAESRKLLWTKYLIIAGTCVLIFLARAGLDVYYYGDQKSEIKTEMAEIYSSPDKKPSAAPEEQCITYHMASKGYSVADLFRYDEHWGIKSFRSYVSARVTIEGDNWYYVAMLILYLVIIGWISYAYISELSRCSGTVEKETKEKLNANIIIYISGIALCAGGVVASILNSYLIDAQAQGRYLLPISLTVGYLSSRVPTLWNKKIFRLIVILAGVLSLMYFGLFDSRKLIDLTYVRELIGA